MPACKHNMGDLQEPINHGKPLCPVLSLRHNNSCKNTTHFWHLQFFLSFISIQHREARWDSLSQKRLSWRSPPLRLQLQVRGSEKQVSLKHWILRNPTDNHPAYNKWHETELERWLSDHDVPYPTPADRKDLENLVKDNWQANVVTPLQSAGEKTDDGYSSVKTWIFDS